MSSISSIDNDNKIFSVVFYFNTEYEDLLIELLYEAGCVSVQHEYTDADCSTNSIYVIETPNENIKRFQKNMELIHSIFRIGSTKIIKRKSKKEILSHESKNKVLKHIPNDIIQYMMIEPFVENPKFRCACNAILNINEGDLIMYKHRNRNKRFKVNRSINCTITNTTHLLLKSFPTLEEIEFSLNEQND